MTRKWDMTTVFTTTTVEELSLLSDQLHKGLGLSSFDSPAAPVAEESVDISGVQVFFGGLPTSEDIRSLLRSELDARPGVDVTFTHVPSTSPKADITAAINALLEART